MSEREEESSGSARALSVVLNREQVGAGSYNLREQVYRGFREMVSAERRGVKQE